MIIELNSPFTDMYTLKFIKLSWKSGLFRWNSSELALTFFLIFMTPQVVFPLP